MGMGTDEHIKAGGRPLGRRAYLVRALPLLLVMYALVVSLRWFAFDDGVSLRADDTRIFGISAMHLLGIGTGVIILSCTSALGWLGTRRALASGASESLVLTSVIPWAQLFAVAWLAFGPSQESEERPSFVILRGTLWGLAIAVAAEIVCTLIFGNFGIALFVGSPFVVGFVTAYLDVRDGNHRPLWNAQAALLLASAVLFGFAFEGLVCLILAYPLATVVTWVGSLLGMMAARMRAGRSMLASSAALLPLMLAAELAQPPLTQFSDTRSVVVDAPPQVVWQSIVHMGTISNAPAAPFGWGLAYPVAGHIDGQGVGAVRRGVFSTGVAYEKVTRWDKDRELWFDVLSNPPMMRETNPFGPVRSAHLDGYFTTADARFTLTALPGSRTRLSLATVHTLRIGPSAYFLPLAHWAVGENKRRVLAHFRDRAEQLVSEGGCARLSCAQSN